MAHSPTPWPWSASPMAAVNPLFCGACTSHATRARFAWHACQNDPNACKNAWHARNSPSPRARVNPACISVHAGSKQRPHERNQRRGKQNACASPRTECKISTTHACVQHGRATGPVRLREKAAAREGRVVSAASSRETRSGCSRCKHASLCRPPVDGQSRLEPNGRPRWR